MRAPRPLPTHYGCPLVRAFSGTAVKSDPMGRGATDMAEKLVADALIEQACQATGLDYFGGDTYREGLDILVNDLNAGAAKGWHTESGIARSEHDISRWLRDRLKVEDYLSQNPELLDRPIERPVFVMGVPRTGTTLMSNLLAADPARRSPLTWEIDDPVPPATSATLTTDPRALARLVEEKAALAANPDMGKYLRGPGIYANECRVLMGP